MSFQESVRIKAVLALKPSKTGKEIVCGIYFVWEWFIILCLIQRTALLPNKNR